MTLIAITQRVDTENKFNERRDCLDQQWIKLFLECKLKPLIIPNDLNATIQLINGLDISGLNWR